MRDENVPTPQSPETPPLAPYDPPDPAPQAAAWRRALKVVVAGPLHADHYSTDDRRYFVDDRIESTSP
jgi:hypothetical protein